MRTTIFGLAAIPALGALVLACGGAVSLAKPEERDSGSPVAQVDAAPPETDASVAPDSPDQADVVVLADARDDVAPNPPEAGPPACSMQLDPTFGVGGISTVVDPPYPRAASIVFE